MVIVDQLIDLRLKDLKKNNANDEHTRQINFIELINAKDDFLLKKLEKRQLEAEANKLLVEAEKTVERAVIRRFGNVKKIKK